MADRTTQGARSDLEAPRLHGMNLPNQLTVGRLFLTMFFVVALGVRFPYHCTVALVLFVIAGITDFVDGEIARRYEMVTDFGKLMDPLIDKVMTAAAFVSLVPLGAIPAWVAIVVISREFLITGLRLLAVSKGKLLSADPDRQTQDDVAIPDRDFLPGPAVDLRIRRLADHLERGGR